jgi:hypothetical protein
VLRRDLAGLDVVGSALVVLLAPALTDLGAIAMGPARYEAQPCGTLRAIEYMMSKLAGHAAFQGAAAEHLKRCGDCRVIDLHTNPNEVRITDL